MFKDQPELRKQGVVGSNSHVTVGAMSSDEWLRLHDAARL